jgi:D-alanyl-D-alanine carboxypeptidase
MLTLTGVCAGRRKSTKAKRISGDRVGFVAVVVVKAEHLAYLGMREAVFKTAKGLMEGKLRTAKEMSGIP